MPGCVLNATGAQFDVDGFMKDSTWGEYASVFHRGEATGLRTRPIQERSGLGVRISDSGEDELEPQIRDAMEFLEQERAEIQRLAAFPGLESLEFRIGLFWWRNTLCQSHTLPPDFLRRAGTLGVAVTLCVYGVSEDEPEAEPGAPPNGGPATPVGTSGVTEGPPSVS
jgi:hypothetical protein